VGNICSGDSGGPTFSVVNGKEVVIGVHSTGSRPCGQVGNDVRTDVYRDWIIKTANGDVGSDVDNFPPSVSIASPSGNATVGSTFTVKVNATDKVGVTRVEVKVDGAKTLTATAPPYSFTLEDVPAGMKFIVANAYDKIGNVGTDTVAVNVVPASPKVGFGAGCSSDADCQSGLCVLDPATSNTFCSAACGSCPESYTCKQITRNRLACLPGAAGQETPASGGCGVAPGDGPRTPWSLLLLLGILAAGWILPVVRARRAP
jgi:hypothetical protein